MQIQTIKNAVIAKLQTLKGFEGVYGFPNPDTTGYPYLCVIFDGDEGQTLTNGQDEVLLTFKILCLQEKLSELKGQENAENTADDRTYKIEKLFRDDNDIGLPEVMGIPSISSKKTYDSGATRIVIETILKIKTVVNCTL